MKKTFSTRSIFLSIIAISLLAVIVIITTTTSRANSSLSARLSGRILLQVEDRGQAWYINPENQKKYYLGSPEESWTLLRGLGVFMNANIINGYLKNGFPVEYSGRIIINSQEKYEAYYINPLDLKGYSLNSPMDTFSIMKKLSLGITNESLKTIKTYNYLDNNIFDDAMLDNNSNIKINVVAPAIMKDFTRIIKLSAEIKNIKDTKVLERGLVWDYVTIPDVSINPTLNNNYRKVLSDNLSDNFSVEAIDLIPGTFVFFRFYVITDNNDVVYSEVDALTGPRGGALPLIPAPSSGTSRGSNDIIEAPKFVLNYGAGTGGDVDGPSLQMVTKGSIGEPVTAKASPGYKFVSWSDGSTDQTRTDAPVDSNVMVIAEFSLVCSQSQVTYYDFTYNTVAIGDQCWLKENLRTARTASGDFILSFCYNGDDRNCTTYGRLYPWASLGIPADGVDSNPSGIQGICPNGWHLPSKSEWQQLITWVSADGGVDPGMEGKSLKASSYRWDPDTGTDDFGFTALPGGRRSSTTGYLGINNLANFWSTTHGGIAGTFSIFYLNSESDEASADSRAYQNDYLSVRCVQN